MSEKHEAVWIDADAEFIEALGREAQLEDESLAEFIDKACRQRANR